MSCNPIPLFFSSAFSASQGKAEVLALAKKMLRRKEKESIIDAAYNRYASHDVGLPRWFEEDEAKHRRCVCTSYHTPYKLIRGAQVFLPYMCMCHDEVPLSPPSVISDPSCR